MNKKKLLYGLSIFATFFGSGNLIYPILVGKIAITQWHWGYLGFLATGVILPFIGLYITILYKGSYQQFFQQVGKFAAIAMPLIMLSLLCSFGTMARCVTVAHEGFSVLTNRVPLWLFSLVFCSLSCLFSWKGDWMFEILGNVLTPLLLFFILLLISLGVYYAPTQWLHGTATAQASLQDGFIQGYNTMDLVASFFVAALLFKEVKLSPSEKKKYTKKQFITSASKIGIGILGLVYLGLTYLGATYHTVIEGLPATQLLPVLAQHVIGSRGGIVIAMIIILSCLTTVVSLSKIYTQYIFELLQLPKKYYFHVLIAVNLICYIVSWLGFASISDLLIPILKIIYPALIALTLLSLMIKKQTMLYKNMVRFIYGTMNGVILLIPFFYLNGL